MPALDALPVGLHSTIALLSALSYVKGVITGIDPYHNKMVIYIVLTGPHLTQMRQTLNCFAGHKPERMVMKDDYMELTLNGTLIAA